MTTLADVMRQAVEADELAREIIHIRVTPDAVPGSLVAVPVTPERLRVIGRLRVGLHGETVEAEPSNALELIIHPIDWRELLLETRKDGAGYVVTTGMERVERIMGIPVSHG